MTNQLTVSNLEYRPVMRALNASARLAENLGLPFGRLERDNIMRAARGATGLTDFGDDGFIEPLDQVLRIAREAEVTPLARVFIRSSVMRALSNRMWITDYVKRHPDVYDVPIEKPIFVLGFPRTGTTALQNHLSAHDDRRALEFWEISNPTPVHDDKAKDERRRIRAAQRILTLGYLVAPEMGEAHEIRATTPEECWPLFFNTFAVLNFDLLSGLREYGDFLLGYDMTRPYEEYRLQLQLLLHRRPAKQLVLKCPEHLWFLDSLLGVFPDACIVWTHRDPVDSIASYCSLISMARRMLWGRIDRERLGRDITERFHLGIQRALDARKRADESRFFDVSFSELVKDNRAMVEQISDHFGLDFPDYMPSRIEAFLDSKRADGRGKHRYDADVYGLDPAAIRARYGDYIDRFEVKCRAA